MMPVVLRAYLLHAVAFAAGICVTWFAMQLTSSMAVRGAQGGVPYLLAALLIVSTLAGYGVYSAVLSALLKIRLSPGWMMSGAGATVVIVLLALILSWGGWLVPMEALIFALVLMFGIGGAAAKRLMP